ncbi:hypothetical protein MY5147_005385 [Beauveria neobassiana]
MLPGGGGYGVGSIRRCEDCEWDEADAEEESEKPAFVNNKLTSEDWAVIAEYLTILKPLKIATKRLEGRLEEGQAWGGLGSPADNGKASEASGGV